MSETTNNKKEEVKEQPTSRMISVLHSTANFEQAEAVRKTWVAKAAKPDRVEWIFGIDRDAVQKAATVLNGVLAISETKGVCCAPYNTAYRYSRGDILIMCADDLECPEQWDVEVDKMLPHDKPAILSVDDGIRKDALITHMIANRLFVENILGGVVIDPDFYASDGIYVDNHFTAMGYENDCVIEAKHLLFKHNHTLTLEPGKATDWQKRHNSKRNYMLGAVIYKDKHLADDWGKVAVFCRIARAPDPMFFVSWSRLLTRGLRQGDVVLTPAIGMPHANACNYGVERFLETTCDSMLFLDDDMVFTYDCLERLRRTGLDYTVLSGLATTKRGYPLPVALNILENGVAVPVEGVNGSGIVDVESAGLAFTLVHRRLIRRLMQDNGNTVNIFSWHNRMGEDGLLYSAAKKYDMKTGVNLDIGIGHRVTMTAFWDRAYDSAIMRIDSNGAEFRIKDPARKSEEASGAMATKEKQGG